MSTYGKFILEVDDVPVTTRAVNFLDMIVHVDERDQSMAATQVLTMRVGQFVEWTGHGHRYHLERVW